MNESLIDTMARTLGEGSSRSGMLQGLTGLVLTGSIAHLGPADAATQKRKKKRKKKRKGRGGNQRSKPPASPPPVGAPPCSGTICRGQCVDLSSDAKHCGACDANCPRDASCVEGRCVRVVGSRGSGDGQFNSPSGIAVNNAGRAFITDTGNRRVALLRGGEFAAFAPGRPVGVAITKASGDVYVTDSEKHAVVRLAADGRVLGEFGSLGSGPGRFFFPSGVAVDNQTAQVFVADTGNHRIQRFSVTGVLLGEFGSEGSGEGQFREPIGLAIGPNREVVVADVRNNRIQVLSQSGGFIRAFGSSGSGPGQFNRPIAVAFDSDGNLFVVESDNHRVQQFTLDGQFVTTFGRAGNGPGQFNGPTGIAIDEGDAILVVDSGNDRVQVFIPGGLRVPGAPAESLTSRTYAHSAKAKKRRASRRGDDGSYD